MKFALCLVFCVGLALASVEQWRLAETYGDEYDSERYFDNEDRFGQTFGDKKQCRVGNRNLKTFEDEHKQISLSTVFKVVSKDCSSHPSYAVLLRKLKPNCEQKIVKIVTRTQNIVLVPSNEFDDQVKVIVNGRQHLINRNVELIPCEDQDLKLVRLGSLIKVVLPQSQVVVQFDGRTCKVQVPRTISQQHCGLCSSINDESEIYSNTHDLLFNDETNDYTNFLSSEDRLSNLRDETDFFGYTQTPFLSKRCPRRNFWNQISEDEQLNTEDVFSNLFDDEESTRYTSSFGPINRLRSQRRNFRNIFDENERFTTLKQQTLLKRKLIRTEDQVCLSTERIPQCPTNTYPQNEIETRVTYKCVYPEKHLIQKLIRQVRNGQSLRELSNQFNTKTRVEVVPTKCMSNY